MKRHPSFTLGVAIVGLLAALALLSGVWLPHDPDRTDPRQRFLQPGADHWFGTDQFGRDVFSRVAVGARTTLSAGLMAVVVGAAGGVALGAFAAWRRGWADEVLMRFVDAVSAFPPILLALLFAAIMGPGAWSGMLAIGIATIPLFARLLRAELLTLREAEFVTAAVAAGAGPGRVWRDHLWRNARSIVLIQSTVAFAHAVLAEAALSYLGLGVQPPTASWGRMLLDAQNFYPFSPYPVLFPGAAIALTVLGFNLLGDGLRDRLDPKLR